jgi:hypothetical protein
LRQTFFKFTFENFDNPDEKRDMREWCPTHINYHWQDCEFSSESTDGFDVTSLSISQLWAQGPGSQGTT